MKNKHIDFDLIDEEVEEIFMSNIPMEVKCYCKKSEIVEAVLYNGTNDYAIMQWSNNKVKPSPVLEPNELNPSGLYLQVETPDGIKTAIVGDYIIKDSKDNFNPCRAEDFEKTYKELRE